MFSKEIHYIWEIAIECIVVAVIILILSVFGGYSRKALEFKNIQDQTMNDISEYRKFYEYTFGIEAKKSEITLGSKDNLYGNVAGGLLNGLPKYRNLSSVVKGDDVIRFIALYPREYDVYIYYTGKNNIEFKKLDENSLDIEWSLYKEGKSIDGVYYKTVIECMGDNFSEDKYYCTVIYDDLLGYYDSIVFTKVPENRIDLEEIGIKT